MALLIAVGLWGAGVSALRTSMGWALFGIFLFGAALWWAASTDTERERGKVWGELGRSLLVAGLLAFAVWAVGELRRPVEAHHALQLTLGAQRAMPGIDLHGEDLGEFNLARKNLSDADLSDTNLSKATLVETDLSDADLSDADLSGADLEHANLSGANLDRAELDGVSADLVDLRGARLTEADLTGAQLSGAKMQSACLSSANLEDAYLPDAKLTGADLTEANLHYTRFWYDLRPAHLEAVGLAGALFAKTARWPPSIGDRYKYLVDPSTSTDKPPPFPRHAPARAKTARVRFVADGDTLELTSEPNRRGKRLRVRLIGIDAPDIGELRGIEARELLRGILPKRTRVTYAYDQRHEDKFGRRLLYVFAPDGRLVNQVLVERGRVVTGIDPPGPHSNGRYTHQLEAGEVWAREHALGMWRSCPQ